MIPITVPYWLDVSYLSTLLAQNAQLKSHRSCAMVQCLVSVFSTNYSFMLYVVMLRISHLLAVVLPWFTILYKISMKMVVHTYISFYDFFYILHFR